MFDDKNLLGNRQKKMKKKGGKIISVVVIFFSLLSILISARNYQNFSWKIFLKTYDYQSSSLTRRLKIIENLISIIVFVIYCSTTAITIEVIYSLSILPIVSFIFGIGAMIFYYKFLHPNILSRRDLVTELWMLYSIYFLYIFSCFKLTKLRLKEIYTT